MIGRDVAYKGFFPPSNLLPSTSHYHTITTNSFHHYQHSIITKSSPVRHNFHLFQLGWPHSCETILLTSLQNIHHYHSLPSSWVVLQRTAPPTTRSRRVRLVTALLLLEALQAPASRLRPPRPPSRPSTAFVRTPATMALATLLPVLAPAHHLHALPPPSRLLLVRLRLLPASLRPVLPRALLHRRHPLLSLLLSSSAPWTT